MFRSFALILTFSGCVACTDFSVKTDCVKSVGDHPVLTLPEIPLVINSQQEATLYLAHHFWDSFDFSDTTYLHSDEVEKWFVNYIGVLRKANRRGNEVNTLLGSMEADNPVWIERFMALADTYLSDPNSLLRDEELYMQFATYAIQSRALDGLRKVRYQQRLALASKNRIGTLAANFPFYTASGKKQQLSDFAHHKVLLFFNNPSCHECQNVKQHLLESPSLRKIVREKELVVLSVYVDRELDVWKNVSHPAEWYNVYDNGWITDHSLYNLEAIPSLYLLDEKQRVVLKDATVEEIEYFL